LLTVLEGLGYSCSPCAEVLSVAGLLSFMPGFPLGFGFILELFSLPDIPTFLTFLTFLTVILVAVRRCSVLQHCRIMREQAAQCGTLSNNEQCVHRCTTRTINTRRYTQEGISHTRRYTQEGISHTRDDQQCAPFPHPGMINSVHHSHTREQQEGRALTHPGTARRESSYTPGGT